MFRAKFSKFKSITEGTSEEYSKNKKLRINAVVIGSGSRGLFGGRGGFGCCGGHGCGGSVRG